ncbi:MAG TPA: hypothetical protein VGP72_21735 [Planctomycetota bacterium]
MSSDTDSPAVPEKKNENVPPPAGAPVAPATVSAPKFASSRDRSNWYVHLDLTAVIIVLILCGIGYLLKHQYDLSAERAAENERVRLAELERRQEKEREEAALARREARAREELARVDSARRLEEYRKKQHERELAADAYKAQLEEKHVEAEVERRKLEAAAREEERKQKAKVIEATRAAYIEAAQQALAAEAKLAFLMGDPANPGELPGGTASIREIKLIALKNKSAGAQKIVDGQRQQLDSFLQAKAVFEPTARATGISKYTPEEEAKLREKLRAAEWELADARRQMWILLRARRTYHDQGSRETDALFETEHQQLRADLEEAKRKREILGEELRQAGEAPPRIEPPSQRVGDIPADNSKEPPATATDAPKPVTPTTTYTMKNGKRIVAIKSVDGGDVITIKTDAGKLMTLDKKDIEKTEERM